MTRQDSTGRVVCDIEFDGRYPDTFISRGTYLDDGSRVPDEELDWMTFTASRNGECLCSQCREASRD